MIHRMPSPPEKELSTQNVGSAEVEKPWWRQTAWQELPSWNKGRRLEAKCPEKMFIREISLRPGGEVAMNRKQQTFHMAPEKDAICHPS